AVEFGRKVLFAAHQPTFAEPEQAMRGNEGLLPFCSRPRRRPFLREARKEERDLVIPNERRIKPHRAKTGPALRVARQMSPRGVAGLDKGLPLPASRALRNAARPGDIWRSNAARERNGNR